MQAMPSKMRRALGKTNELYHRHLVVDIPLRSHSSFSQDRVTLDGSLTPGGLAAPSRSERAPSYVVGTPLPGAKPAPTAPPLDTGRLEQLVAMLQRCRGDTLVITGAGCSTESSIPDYRSPGGAYSSGFKPMTHQAFMASSDNRARYWARSFAGWLRFSKVEPNGAHEGLARLQKLGWVADVITQNVDRLHQKAGTGAVLELHGTTHEVVCMGCGTVSPREEMQRRLEEANPAAAAEALAGREGEAEEQERLVRAGSAEPVPAGFRERRGVQRPDGDVEITEEAFVVPPCTACGGFLKPDVVFFGDSLPPHRAQKAEELASQAKLVLVVGSSLAVWSAYRLVKAAKENGAQLAVVNVGPTRAEDFTDLKLAALASEVVMRAATHPTLLVPPLKQ